MVKKRTGIAVLTMLLAISTLSAQDTRVENLRTEDLDLSVENIEPNITIKQYDNHIAEEYRVNNNLYMVKITPSIGAPYYLVDPDGDGVMGWRRNSVGMDIVVPQWVLFSW